MNATATILTVAGNVAAESTAKRVRKAIAHHLAAGTAEWERGYVQGGEVDWNLVSTDGSRAVLASVHGAYLSPSRASKGRGLALFA